MTDKNTSIKENNASDHLANERTLLAWIRTAIGIMAFGFVVVKFSLFVRQLSFVLGRDMPDTSHGYSGIIGIILVGVGAFTLFLSLLRFLKTKRELENNSYKNTSAPLMLLVALIILISLFLIAYLIKSM